MKNRLAVIDFSFGAKKFTTLCKTLNPWMTTLYRIAFRDFAFHPETLQEKFPKIFLTPPFRASSWWRKWTWAIPHSTGRSRAWPECQAMNSSGKSDWKTVCGYWWKKGIIFQKQPMQAASMTLDISAPASGRNMEWHHRNISDYGNRKTNAP